MLKDSYAFSGFSVKDQDEARKFYSETLGLTVKVTPMGLELHTQGNNPIFIYAKDDHKPANFTILNFPVADIDKVVSDLKNKGVKFDTYDFGDFGTDENNIVRGKAANQGPDIAWFKDPSGNIISLLQS